MGLKLALFFSSLIGVAQQVSAFNSALDQFIDYYEDVLYRFEEHVLDLYSQSCLLQCDDCSVLACQADVTDAICLTEFGQLDNCLCQSRQLDFDRSYVRTPLKLNTDSIPDLCWTEYIDSHFKSEMDNTDIKWQSFASPDGFYRSYPGVAQETCDDYDPRYQSWYSRATSEPKNVVIVLDISGSMSFFDRDSMTRETIRTILSTLNLEDYFSLVTFSSVSDTLTGNTLIKGTPENINSTLTALDGIEFYGGSNFEAGINRGFDILDQSSQGGCRTAFVLVNDDGLNTGKFGTELINVIMSRNTAHNATIFTVPIQLINENSISRDISCQTNGFFLPVNRSNDIRGELAQYYDYFASMNENRVVWTQPYLDSFNIGNITTVSLAVYDPDSDPKKLVGVISIDFLIDRLRQLVSEDQLTQFFNGQELTCSDLKLTNCQKENLRRDIKFNLTDLSCDSSCPQIESLTCESDLHICPSSKLSYDEMACCPGCIPSSSSYISRDKSNSESKSGFIQDSEWGSGTESARESVRESKGESKNKSKSGDEGGAKTGILVFLFCILILAIIAGIVLFLKMRQHFHLETETELDDVHPR